MVSAPFQAQAQRKRAEDNANRSQTIPFRLLLAGDFGRRGTSAKPGAAFRSAVRVVGVPVLDVGRFLSLSLSDPQTREERIQHALTTETGAQKKQKERTGDCSDDDSGNRSATQTTAFSMDADQRRPVRANRRLEALGRRDGSSRGDSGCARAADWRRGRRPDGRAPQNTFVLAGTDIGRSAAFVAAFRLADLALATSRSAPRACRLRDVAAPDRGDC